MSKINATKAAQTAKYSGQWYQGLIHENGRYQPHYSQGLDAYFARTPFSSLWHVGKQSGWKKALANDVKQLNTCHKVSLRDKITLRIFEASGLNYI